MAQFKQEAGLDDRPRTRHLSSSSDVGVDWLCVAVSLGRSTPHSIVYFMQSCLAAAGKAACSLHPAQWQLSQLSFPLAQLSPAGCRDSWLRLCDALCVGLGGHHRSATLWWHAAICMCVTLTCGLVDSWPAFGLLFQQAALPGLCSTCWSSVCLQHSACSTLRLSKPAAVSSCVAGPSYLT